jgi:hypothetical protein
LPLLSAAGLPGSGAPLVCAVNMTVAIASAAARRGSAANRSRPALAARQDWADEAVG